MVSWRDCVTEAQIAKDLAATNDAIVEINARITDLGNKLPWAGPSPGASYRSRQRLRRLANERSKLLEQRQELESDALELAGNDEGLSLLNVEENAP